MHSSRPQYSQVEIYKILEKNIPNLTYEDLEQLSYSLYLAISDYEKDSCYTTLGTKDILRKIHKSRREIKNIIELVSSSTENQLCTFKYIREGAEDVFPNKEQTYHYDKKNIVFLSNLEDDLKILLEITKKSIDRVHKDTQIGRKKEESKLLLACDIATLLWEYTKEKPTSSKHGLLFVFFEYALEKTNTRIENIHHILSKALATAND